MPGEQVSCHYHPKRKGSCFKIALLLREASISGLIQCKILRAAIRPWSGTICPLVEQSQDGCAGDQLFSDWKEGLLHRSDSCLVL